MNRLTDLLLAAAAVTAAVVACTVAELANKRCQKWVKRLYERRQAKECYPMLIHQQKCHSYYRDVHYYVMVFPAHCLLIGYGYMFVFLS